MNRALPSRIVGYPRSTMNTHIEANRALWDELVGLHVRAYDVETFREPILTTCGWAPDMVSNAPCGSLRGHSAD